MLPWACNNVREFQGKDTAKLSLKLDNDQKERVVALDAHLLSAFNKYKKVLRCTGWRDTLKEDYISAKMRHRDGMITTKVYDPDGEPVTPDSLMKGATVTVQLQPRYIYGVSGTGGLTWEVLKARVDAPGEEDMEFVQ